MEFSAKKTKLMTNNTSGINKDQSKLTKAWDSHKLQVPSVVSDESSKPELLSRIAQMDNSIDKVETNFERQERFSQFQD